MLNIKYKQKTNTQYEEEQKMKKFDFVIILIAATFLISGCAQALTGAAEAGFATWGMTEKAKIEKQEREQEAKTSIIPEIERSAGTSTTKIRQNPTAKKPPYEDVFLENLK